MDLLRLKALVELVARTGIAELELTEGEDSVRIINDPARGSIVSAPAVPSPAPAAPRPPVTASKPQERLIRAPMHGVFHQAPAPGEPPFVTLGQAVEPGQKLGLLEAMKVFNAVVAEAGGVIEAVLAESGQEVAMDQPLFRLA